MEPWNEFEAVSKTHYGIICSFTVLMLTELTNYFFFQEMHSEQNPEVRQTGGGAKRVETVSNAVTYYYFRS